jgi:hypothetical protein
LREFGNSVEVLAGNLVLRGDPFGDLGRVARIVFQPAIRVGDLHGVVLIDLIDAAGFGIGQWSVLGVNAMRPSNGAYPCKSRHC